MHSQPCCSSRRLQTQELMAAESIQSKDWLSLQSSSVPASRPHESWWRKTEARSKPVAAQRCLLHFLHKGDPFGGHVFQLLGSMLIGSLGSMCIQSGEPRSTPAAVLVCSCRLSLLVGFDVNAALTTSLPESYILQPEKVMRDCLLPIDRTAPVDQVLLSESAPWPRLVSTTGPVGVCPDGDDSRLTLITSALVVGVVGINRPT